MSRSMTGVASMMKRDDRIVALFASGKTTSELGSRYHVSDERIRQIIHAAGLDRTSGGASVRHQKRLKAKDSKRIKRKARTAKYYGCDYEEMLRIRAEFDGGGDPVFAFREQRRAQRKYAPRTPWTLTLSQWWSVWKASRAWRYRRWMLGDYGMKRIDPKKGWVAGNVSIVRVKSKRRTASSKSQAGERRAQKTYGCSLDELRRIRAAAKGGRDPVAVFLWTRSSIRSAFGPDAWKLTLPEWWNLWETCGDWTQRRAFRLVRRRQSVKWTVRNVLLVRRNPRTLH